ncbi:photosystem II stability/assembly factor-like uncharacterized protein [Povalibacter uvarum]|uniref:Photosystem II stability/assembly factor-like uncharacterized protein n=1 Tax=Povalibacter uvarum TaxID=732238 RepID=A0A841HRR7_9GAMM|nr:YCF48-related protein [Povalibacter uvarum]MBB6094722.1 photosystem II stability/assembly factor-like uncharacterized protein [Povalibacter uvarum]
MASRLALSIIGLTLAAHATAAPSKGTSQDAVAPPEYTAQVINPELTGGLHVATTHLVWGTDGTVLLSTDGRGWTHALTSITADLAHAAADPTGKVIVAVGAKGTIIRSTDGGRRWQATNSDALSADLKAVVHQSSRNAWIAAGTQGKILRSTDDGASWQLVQSNLGTTLLALFVDPATDLLLIGGENGLVGSSRDGGASWQLTWIAMSEPRTPISGFHRHDRLLLATSALGRFLTSTDDAKSWDLLQSQTRAFFTDSAFDGGHRSTVLIGHDGTVLRSPDGGETWKSDVIAVDGSSRYLSAVRYDRRGKSLIAVGHGGLVARSTDGGVHWTQGSPGVGGNIDGLIETASDELVAFGNGGQLLASTTSGASWTTLRPNLDFYLREITTTPRASAFVATGQLGTLLRSADGGTWRELPTRYPNPQTPPDLRALVATEDGLIAAGPPGAILRSDATGENWSLQHWTPIEDGRAFPAVIVDTHRSAIVTVEAHGAMRVARRDSNEWDQVDVPTDGEFWQGAVLEHDGMMIVAGKAGTVARSNDSGKHWHRVDAATKQDLFGAFADDSRGTLYLMGHGGTLLRSTDRGTTWSRVDSDTTQPLRRMLRDPRSGALICFGGNGVIVRSIDGQRWQRMSSGVSVELRKDLIEPRTNNLLIAGRQGVILRSTDGGLTWAPLNTHTTRNFTSIAANRTGELVAVGERIVRLTPRSQP